MGDINTNGVVIFEGASTLDGAPIAVIVTGLDAGSENQKTGSMLQTWIIRADIHPVRAAGTGADSSICGQCPHRGRYIQFGRWNAVINVKRTCYVELGRAPAGIYGCYIRGGYALAADRTAIGRGRLVRLGAYGDPGAVPIHVWRELLAEAVGFTGYTHQWRRRPALRRYCMASVDSPAEAETARAAGWRTFRVGAPGDVTRMRDEGLCPASEEAGKRVTCSDCLACDGSNGRKYSMYIPGHGSAGIQNNLTERFNA